MLLHTLVHFMAFTERTVIIIIIVIIITRIYIAPLVRPKDALHIKTKSKKKRTIMMDACFKERFCEEICCYPICTIPL